ncbi:MAG TPA: hypothetical protein PLH57_04550, partial [Oligoflexia bacterium]|nr:hypothetical protein [Oligoflexia bacterium]
LPGARLRLFGTYIITTGVCFLLLYWWIVKNGYQPTWQAYFRDQVLSSALEGRGGAQTGEPLYFVKILAQYYWPWMPFLLLGIWRSLKWLFTFEITDEAIYSWIFGVFALGFIVGFSAVKWKFWYYIAPAYPALALFIASTMYSGVRKWAQAPLFRNIIIAASITWFVVGSILPIPLHRERVPEVQAFKETIRRSNVEGNVLFFGAPGDHNMVATSGDWYFGKRVEKIDSISELARKLDSRKSAWLIVDNQFLERCGEEWCRRTIPIQAAHGTTLALYR